MKIVGLVVAVGGLAGIAWWLVSKNSPPPPAPRASWPCQSAAYYPAGYITAAGPADH